MENQTTSPLQSITLRGRSLYEQITILPELKNSSRSDGSTTEYYVATFAGSSRALTLTPDIKALYDAGDLVSMTLRPNTYSVTITDPETDETTTEERQNYVYAGHMTAKQDLNLAKHDASIKKIDLEASALLRAVENAPLV